MTSESDAERCPQLNSVAAYITGALRTGEASAVEVHIAQCVQCQEECAALRRVVDSLEDWRAEMLRPAPSLWDRLVERIDAVEEAQPVDAAQWREPDWEDVAPGISCKLLSNNPPRDRVTMLVRLAPGVNYPPHTHAGAEELHLLSGDLRIDDRKLYPGEYNRAERGTADKRVWSETGCTCLLITSPSDVLA